MLCLCSCMRTEQDLFKLIDKTKTISNNYTEIIQSRLDNLTKPLGSLGLLEEFVKKLGNIQETVSPKIKKKRVYVFASDHGITQERVSAYPSSVTAQMVLNFLKGGASINVLAQQFNVEVKVVDVGVNYDFLDVPNIIERKIAKGTKNFLLEPAMTREQALKSIFIGIELAKQSKEDQVDCLVPGDMGIGNTTPSSAITSLICKKPVEEVTGKGTGLSDEGLQHKVKVLKRTLETRKVNLDDPLNILSQVGGFEIGAIAGLALGCSYYNIPLIADGFISTTGIALGTCFSSKVKDIVFPSHSSLEKGHSHLLQFLNLRPVLNLDMRLGEGTGGVLAVALLESAINLYNNMATFESAGVDKRE